MKSVEAVYRGPRNLAVGDVAVPEPGPGEVRIDVAYTGICGTDLHIYHGDMAARITEPRVIGHEMSGRIGALGSGVQGWSVGDSVGVVPLRSCGSCPACLAGMTHICHRLDFVGIDSPGAMRTHWVVSADLLIALPGDLDLRHAALLEPTAVAVHDVRRAGVLPGEQVVVVGGGPIGVLIAVVARESGADVVVVETAAFRREVAATLGFRSLDPAADDVVEQVQEWTAGAGAAVSFEVSGAAAGVDTAVKVLATRGRLCLVAIHSEPRQVDLFSFFWRELTLVAARLYERADVERAAELLIGGAVPADLLISLVVPLADVTAAFDALEQGAGVMKVLIDCGSSLAVPEPAR